VVAVRSRRYRTASWWESPLIDVGIRLAALVATGLTVWYSLGPTPPSHGSDKDPHVAVHFVDAFAILLAVVWRPGRGRQTSEGRDAAGRRRAAHRGGVIEIAQGASSTETRGSVIGWRMPLGSGSPS